MSNDYTKIAAGLDAIENNVDPTAPGALSRSMTLEDLSHIADKELEALVGANAIKDSDLAEFRELAINKAAIIDRYLADDLTKLDAIEKSVRDRVDKMKLSSLRDRERIVADDIRVAQKDVIAKSKLGREDAMDGLRTAYRQAELIQRFNKNPMQVLTRMTLGDPRRGVYQEQIRNLNVHELANVSELAIVTANLALAGACLARWDEIPARHRPFTPVSYAHAVVGKQFRATLTAIETIKTAYTRAVRMNHDHAMGRRPNATAKIAAGLNSQRVAELAGGVS